MSQGSSRARWLAWPGLRRGEARALTPPPAERHVMVATLLPGGAQAELRVAAPLDEAATSVAQRPRTTPSVGRSSAPRPER